MLKIWPGLCIRLDQNEGISMIKKILMIDDDVLFLKSWSVKLKQNFSVCVAQNIEQALEILKKREIDLVTLDVHLGGEIGLQMIEKIREVKASIPVVMISGDTNTKVIVEAIRKGANDYLRKPFSKDEFFATLEKLEKFNAVSSQNAALIEHIKSQDSRSLVMGRSKRFADLLKQVSKVKGFDANLLIEGESGTGKEVLAKHIHNLENSSERPFVSLNCAAIPDNLFESELFGYEKGSFSGAIQAKAGLIELANGGDLFLDEINSLKYESQAKLLRVLEEKEIRRIGGTVNIPVSFRLIAATNFSLEKLVKEGKFREDLYHRLKVLSFCIPSLRERPEDIPVLVENFIKEFQPNSNLKFSQDSLNLMKIYHWPGNIRELKNIVQRMVILCDSDCVEPKDLPEWLQASPVKVQNQFESDMISDEETQPLKNYVKQHEKAYIKRVLAANDFNKEETAKKLHISRSSLFLKLKEHALMN